MVLKGVCPKCGVTYYGWALGKPNNQRCEKCERDLVITNDGMVQEKENSTETSENESDEDK
jgi:uncharacterized protein (DUF983 family)